MITNELKQLIRNGLIKARSNFEGSDNKWSTSIEINAAQWSRIKNGDIEKVLSDAKWITLARFFDIQLEKEKEWKTANTPVFIWINEQLSISQQHGTSFLLCDIANIGKTYAAKIYAQTHKNAIYVDCSQVKSRQRLIRYIARLFGVGSTGRYYDVYEDLAYYLRSIAHPLIILDEAGDLSREAFLELKALWNVTEHHCGWCMMGADGLEEKIRRSIDRKKVGYTEIFSRFGGKYQRVTPNGADEQRKFKLIQASLIIKANADDNADVQKIITKTDGGSPRKIYDLLKITA